MSTYGILMLQNYFKNIRVENYPGLLFEYISSEFSNQYYFVYNSKLFYLNIIILFYFILFKFIWNKLSRDSFSLLIILLLATLIANYFYVSENYTGPIYRIIGKADYCIIKDSQYSNITKKLKGLENCKIIYENEIEKYNINKKENKNIVYIGENDSLFTNNLNFKKSPIKLDKSDITIRDSKFNFPSNFIFLTARYNKNRILIITGNSSAAIMSGLNSFNDYCDFYYGNNAGDFLKGYYGKDNQIKILDKKIKSANKKSIQYDRYYYIYKENYENKIQGYIESIDKIINYATDYYEERQIKTPENVETYFNIRENRKYALYTNMYTAITMNLPGIEYLQRKHADMKFYHVYGFIHELTHMVLHFEDIEKQYLKEFEREEQYHSFIEDLNEAFAEYIPDKKIIKPLWDEYGISLWPDNYDYSKHEEEFMWQRKMDKYDAHFYIYSLFERLDEKGQLFDFIRYAQSRDYWSVCELEVFDEYISKNLNITLTEVIKEWRELKDEKDN
ncbi:MAG: hypothetical protein ACOCUI_02110 [bacterium]